MIPPPHSSNYLVVLHVFCLIDSSVGVPSFLPNILWRIIPSLTISTKSFKSFSWFNLYFSSVFITHFITAFIAPVLGLLNTWVIMWYEFTRCFFSGKMMISNFKVPVWLCCSLLFSLSLHLLILIHLLRYVIIWWLRRFCHLDRTVHDLLLCLKRFSWSLMI